MEAVAYFIIMSTFEKDNAFLVIFGWVVEVEPKLTGKRIYLK